MSRARGPRTLEARAQEIIAFAELNGWTVETVVPSELPPGCSDALLIGGSTTAEHPDAPDSRRDFFFYLALGENERTGRAVTLGDGDRHGSRFTIESDGRYWYTKRVEDWRDGIADPLAWCEDVQK